MAITSLSRTAGSFRLSALATSLFLALPSFAATVDSVDPAGYPYVVQNGTTTISNPQIDVTGADVTLGSVVQKHGVLARSNGADRAVIHLGDASTQTVQITVDSSASSTPYEVTAGVTAANDSATLPGGLVSITG